MQTRSPDAESPARNAMKLENKVTLITGGASGIGLACCRLFAREGARVVVADQNSEAGRAAVAELNATDADAIFVPVDVADSASVRAMVASVP